MKSKPLFVLLCSLLLPTSVVAAGQSPPAAACTPRTLEVEPGQPALSITFASTATPGKRNLVDHLVVSQNGVVLQELKVHGQVSVADDTGSFRGVDLNDDGLEDIEFITSRGAANAYADYWLYSPSKKQFSYLGNYPVFTRDPQTHLLKTYETSQAGLQYASKQYAFRGGKLELMRSETRDEIKTSGLFRLTIKERIHGVLKTTTQKTVRPPS